MPIGKLFELVSTVEYESLRPVLAEAVKQAELTGPWKEVYEDGTAKPPQAPQAVRSLDDGDQRDRADVIWHCCYRLACLISQWHEWLLDAPLSGCSDPDFAYILASGVEDCVRTLCELGLFKEPVGRVSAEFPDPGRVPASVPWYRWPEGAGWMHGSVERLRRLEPLRDQLWWCIRTLEIKPTTLLIPGLQPLSVEPTDKPPNATGNASPAPPDPREPVAMPTAPAAAEPGNLGRGVTPPRKPRKRRRNGDARDLLLAALSSLAAKGQWGKTNVAIFTLADISRDSFYRLKRDNESIDKKLSEYERRTLGRGPVRADDL